MAFLLLSPVLVTLAIAGLLAAAVVDAVIASGRWTVERRLPSILSRGAPARLTALARADGVSRITLRQPGSPELTVEPPQGETELEAEVTAGRRGRHQLAGLGMRFEGPLGLAARYRRGSDGEVSVYPDMPAARALAIAVREGRLRDPALRPRGPLGLGTEFESIRDYVPDDDIRQVNWRATARLGRPMSNQYRVEQDRDVICVVDAGRLMAAPLDQRNRLDAALDAVAAVALVADEVGDHSGALAFAADVERFVRPRRKGARAVVEGLYDLEASVEDSDYERAFRLVEGRKRAFVIVFSDLIDETAARPLAEAVPVLARRHAVAVATAQDPDLLAAVATPPDAVADVHRMAIAHEMLEARGLAAARIRAAGAMVIEAPASELAGACVRAYLRAKARAAV